jgi:hypothetical protein
MNLKNYNDYKNKDEDERLATSIAIADGIMGFPNRDTALYPIKHPESFRILFTYITPNNALPNADTQFGYVDSFFTGFDELIDNNSYDHNIELIVDSIDIFGLGFSLQYIANGFNIYGGLTLPDFTRLSTFFHKMYDFNPSTRVTDIDILLNEYENVLLEIGVLTRLNKSFQNNILTNGSPEIIRQSIVDEKSPAQHLSQHLSQELQEFAYEDPIYISVKCPEDKEFNPKTKRCVKKCPENYERNADFKCKSKTKKYRVEKQFKKVDKQFKRIDQSRPAQQSHSVQQKIKICGADKELNPKTNRCVKNCQANYERDANFNCKSKTKKNRLVQQSRLIQQLRLAEQSRSSQQSRSAQQKIKICDYNKELNPKTNRCIKNCPANYERDFEFKCKSNKKSKKIM